MKLCKMGLFILIIMVFSIVACNRGSSSGTVVVPSSKTITKIDAVASYLASAKGGASLDDPIPLRVKIDLQNMTASEGGWRNLIDAINTAGKYVALDLSDCTMPNTVFNSVGNININLFNPTSNVNTGENLIVILIIPETAESIEDMSFILFNNLREVAGLKVANIGNGAFYGCTNLVNVFFPVVTSIGREAFYFCTDLTNVSFPKATSIGGGAFFGCTSLINVGFPMVNTIEDGYSNNYLGYVGAFSRCTNLSTVLLPSVTSIGRYAFAYCDSLSSITLGAITPANFSDLTWLGNLRDVYFGYPEESRAGTYVTTNPGYDALWVKQ